MKACLLCIFIVMFFFLFISMAKGQCPDDPKELIINTQEKYDYFFKTYPNCKDYEVHMVNGKFIGDPNPLKYLASLFLLLSGVLLTLKFTIQKFKLD